MKKTLVSALTTALVVGAASTTFAAANPFSDVPEDHWAYDAVAQLAADGVIEGYGDTTFRGDRNITRYEMAQMVARAMANSGLSAADKALIDRLAAEFADELNNLGVRVAELEKHADKVKWTGKAEYTYTHQGGDQNIEGKSNTMLFRLEPTAEVNDHWQVKARLDGTRNMSTDEDDVQVNLKRVWAEGQYGNVNLKFGRMELLSQEAKGQVGALVFDDNYSGASVTYANKNFTGTLFGGRLNWEDNKNWRDGAFPGNANASMIGLELEYESDKFVGGAAYYHLKDSQFDNLGAWTGRRVERYSNNRGADTAGIWALNAGYHFDKNSFLLASYARNQKADDLNNSWQVEFDYKGAKPEDKGSWGAWIGYRKLGNFSSLLATGDDAIVGTKGLVLGANYTLLKNIVLTGRYFEGNTVADMDNDKVRKGFARVEFFF